MNGLYIHIPFCNRLCKFCDFPKRINQKQEVIDNYLDKLIKDLNKIEDHNIDTIYIGGGTPNSLSLKQLEFLFENIKKINFKEIIEYTIETNYELITQEQVNLFNKYGINRVSIGVQTLNKSIADNINKYCDYNILKEKVNLLKSSGINNINLDFIFGLPNESLEDVKENLKYIKELDIPHISYYSLILEDKTVLQHEISNNKIVLPNDEITGEMFQMIIKTLKEYGYHHYEISNFSKDGYESKHNILYWNLDDYIGIGMSAASYYKGIRTYNSKLLTNYMFDSGIIKEEVDIESSKGEYFWIGLRMIDGVSINKYKSKYNSDPFVDFNINDLINKNLLVIDGDMIKLTELGLEHGNYVFEKFI